MVQAIPGEQLKRERTISHEMNRMRMYVVHTPGYVNHSVFRFRSVGGTAFTYILYLARAYASFQSDPIPRKSIQAYRGLQTEGTPGGGGGGGGGGGFAIGGGAAGIDRGESQILERTGEIREEEGRGAMVSGGDRA